MNRATKIEEVALAPIGCAILSRDTQVIERAGWYQTITPSTGTTQGNEVVWSQIAAGDVERVVDETIAQYAVHRVPFRWCVNPLTEPSSVGATLEARGFTSHIGRGMAIEPRRWVPREAAVTVEKVSEANLADYYDAWSRGWETTSPDPDEWCAEHARALATGRFHFYLARVDGQAAGTAGFVTKPRCAYLVGGNVLPQFRGNGVYRALLDVRFAELRTRGVELAVTHAREATSAPILEKLGFENLFRAFIYRWQP